MVELRKKFSNLRFVLLMTHAEEGGRDETLSESGISAARAALTETHRRLSSIEIGIEFFICHSHARPCQATAIMAHDLLSRAFPEGTHMIKACKQISTEEWDSGKPYASANCAYRAIDKLMDPDSNALAVITHKKVIEPLTKRILRGVYFGSELGKILSNRAGVNLQEFEKSDILILDLQENTFFRIQTSKMQACPAGAD